MNWHDMDSTAIMLDNLVTPKITKVTLTFVSYEPYALYTG